LQGQDSLQRLPVVYWSGLPEIHSEHYRSTEQQDTEIKLNSENISNIQLKLGLSLFFKNTKKTLHNLPGSLKTDHKQRNIKDILSFKAS